MRRPESRIMFCYCYYKLNMTNIKRLCAISSNFLNTCVFSTCFPPPFNNMQNLTPFAILTKKDARKRLFFCLFFDWRTKIATRESEARHPQRAEYQKIFRSQTVPDFLFRIFNFLSVILFGTTY